MNEVIRLPREVEFIIERLNASGHRADVVGGPVRDFLLGIEPHDYDVTTDARPERVMEVFSDSKIVPTGIKHGTVSLILGKNSYEITTYRIDGEYKESRHPESVSFTDKLADDLARRDFTVNAIAYNYADGITDLYGGREDIDNRIIRAVGDPYERFREDALRILRAIRFAATLGFEIDGRTSDAILAEKDLLRKVSAERIYVEFSKMLSGKYALSVFDSYREVIAVFLPCISNSPLPDCARFERADYLTRLLSFFALSGASGDDFLAAMTALKTDRKLRDTGAAVLRSLNVYPCDSLVNVGIMLKNLGKENSERTIKLEILLGSKDETARGMLSEYLELRLPYSVRDLALDGADLVALGYEGRIVGDLLSELLDGVIRAEIKNEREALISYLRDKPCK